MVRLGAEAQVGLEGGVQASLVEEFGKVLWVAVSRILEEMVMGCCFGNGGVGGWSQGGLGRGLGGCEASCLGEIGGGIEGALLGGTHTGFSGKEEEEEARIFSGKRRDSGALRALDSLTLSWTTKRRKKEEKSEAFYQLGRTGRALGI